MIEIPEKTEDLPECGNPSLTKIASTQARYIAKDNFRKIVRDGKHYCAWCGKVELSDKRRKYCSELCLETCGIFCFPSERQGFAFHLRKQDYKCNICGFDFGAVVDNIISYRKSNGLFKSWDSSDRFKNVWRIREGSLWSMPDALAMERRPELDHVIPIKAGGDSIGFYNMQVICYCCHKMKTKQDAKDIAHYKRILKEAKNDNTIRIEQELL